MSVSLRELVLLVAVIASAALMLSYSNAVIAGLGMLVVAAMLIAMLARIAALNGTPRAYAIAFLFSSLGYAATLLALESMHAEGDFSVTEFDPYFAMLPTSRVMLPLMTEIQDSRSYWIDPNGEHLPDGPPGFFERIGGSSGTLLGWEHVQRPLTEDFMAVAHCLWTLLFGWLAGKHAAWLYRRRVAGEHVTDKPGKGASG